MTILYITIPCKALHWGAPDKDSILWGLNDKAPNLQSAISEYGPALFNPRGTKIGRPKIYC